MKTGTRSLATIKNNTTVLQSFKCGSERFDLRTLTFRKDRHIYLVTNSNLTANLVNATKIAPVVEFVLTRSNKIRFSYKPSHNYSHLKGYDEVIMMILEVIINDRLYGRMYMWEL